MSNPTEIYTVITHNMNDEYCSWSFHTREEADEFAKKIQELDDTLRVEYNYIRDFEVSVDEALTDFKNWVGLDDDEDEEFEEGEQVVMTIPPESLCGKFIRENNPTTDEIIQFLAHGTQIKK